MINLITGPMFAGKTSKAIKLAEQSGDNILYLKPPVDDRYVKDSVVTHDGIQRKAVILNGGGDIDKYLKFDYAPKAVVIDELHLHNEDVAFYAMHAFASMGLPIFVTGLNYYFDGSVPPAIKRLRSSKLPLKEIPLLATCHICGADAEYTAKLTDSTQVLEVGGAETYQPICEKCFRGSILEQKTIKI